MSDTALPGSRPGAGASRVCANCGAVLQGAFCHDCGQKAAHHQLDVRHFLHEATHEFLHLDGKILQTLRLLLFKPGELTRQFIAGRRAQYITPIRLYLTFSLLFFALAAVFQASGGGEFKVGLTPAAPGQRRSAFEQRLDAAIRKSGEHGGVGEAVIHNLPKAMFVLMPMLALLTWAFYRRQQPYYIPHLYYAVHFNAFVFFVLSCALLLALAGRPGRLGGSLLVWTAVPYHFMALRRVFGGSRTATLAKGMAIGVIYWFLVLAAVLLVTLAVLLSA